MKRRRLKVKDIHSYFTQSNAFYIYVYYYMKKKKSGLKKIRSSIKKQTYRVKEKIRKSVRPKPSILKPPLNNLKRKRYKNQKGGSVSGKRTSGITRLQKERTRKEKWRKRRAQAAAAAAATEAELHQASPAPPSQRHDDVVKRITNYQGAVGSVLAGLPEDLKSMGRAQSPWRTAIVTQAAEEGQRRTAEEAELHAIRTGVGGSQSPPTPPGVGGWHNDEVRPPNRRRRRRRHQETSTPMGNRSRHPPTPRELSRRAATRSKSPSRQSGSKSPSRPSRPSHPSPLSRRSGSKTPSRSSRSSRPSPPSPLSRYLGSGGATSSRHSGSGGATVRSRRSPSRHSRRG